MLGPCWPMLGHLGSYVGAMFGPSMLTILRCQFFRAGPPPGAQNHVKTDVS